MGRMLNKYYVESQSKQRAKEKMGKEVGRGVRATVSTLVPC